MKVTFPFMGTTLIFEKLFQLFGHKVIAPPRPTQRTIDLGVKYSPEFACYPYKVLLGSYIEALEQGAQVVVTSGGSGPCRAGYYSEVHLKTLRHMGYDVDFIVFDDFKRDPALFMENIRRIKGANSWTKAFRIVLTVYELARALDRLQKTVELQRAYESEKGSFNKAFDEITRRFAGEVRGVGDVKRLYREAAARLAALPCRETPEPDKIRIGIVGEIYVVMEPSINMNIAEVLNNLGCEVSRSMYISEWVDHNFWPKFLTHKSGEWIIQKSKDYIEIGIGGHERHNIGNIIHYKEMGFDGVIHLMPFACLPELITQSVIPRIAQDWDIPILTLALDEQTGIANNLTRIEAFVELLRNAKWNHPMTPAV